MKKIISAIVITFLFIEAHSQQIPPPDTSKKYSTARVTVAPKIDGVLDDEAWTTVSAKSDFVMSRPIEFGMPTQKTEFRIVYDNTAIYVSAMMYGHCT